MYQSRARQSSSGKPLLSGGISQTFLRRIVLHESKKTETQPDVGTSGIDG
ncbi:MAG: hypothetical protein HFH72_07870 [Lachnospiraceae bacterium]|nr:hypothetical protein [Lachnospiraceae bacterium]